MTKISLLEKDCLLDIKKKKGGGGKKWCLLRSQEKGRRDSVELPFEPDSEVTLHQLGLSHWDLFTLAINADSTHFLAKRPLGHVGSLGGALF